MEDVKFGPGWTKSVIDWRPLNEPTNWDHKMTEKTGVVFDTLSVGPARGGLRVTLEGFVPFELVPAPDPRSSLETRKAFLEKLSEAWPELIPDLWRSR